MGTCLNLLGETFVFIPTVALLALVLLNWLQFHLRGREEGRNVNWVCGVSWAFLALLFALTAVALFICEMSTCAKGFLILAFFMTGINIAFIFGQNIVRLFGDLSEESFGQSLFGECGKSKWWILFWVFLLIGLGFISFSLVNKLCSPFLWAGVGLIVIVVLCACGLICRGFNLRWFLWERRVWERRARRH